MLPESTALRLWLQGKDFLPELQQDLGCIPKSSNSLCDQRDTGGWGWGGRERILGLGSQV